ncbi:hypothetical protein [Chlorogloeopsis sp. ULAP02]|uniref:hypothetical protein n=1 Tax=Chlorogloeopsis sp. ULAP02 TaxID=3107926 RepID=UPI0031365149
MICINNFVKWYERLVHAAILFSILHFWVLRSHCGEEESDRCNLPYCYDQFVVSEKKFILWMLHLTGNRNRLY